MMGADASVDWSPSQRARLADWDVEQSVDVHCHCLPGVDDGPETLKDSLALCRALVADGVTTVFATPHQLGRYDGINTAASIRQALAELQAELSAANIPLVLVPGADVRIDERLVRLVESGDVLTAGPLGRHLLLELPHGLFVDPLPAIAALQERGIQTIMTHPERHRYLAGSTRRLESWVAAGAAIQITAGSLVGEFGALAEQEAWRMVDAGMVSLVASDAHDARRPPRLSIALEALAEEVGREYARTVCLENPLQVLRGTPVAACRPV
jgi:protein-tyrosine phosphatase